LYHGDVVLPTSLSGGNGQLYFVTSKLTKSGTIYIKVVNTSPDAQDTQIKINGATSIDATGKATVLTSASVKDTNTLNDPTKVVPVTHVLSFLSSSFTYSFAPNSVTVLQLTERNT
jgi:alpha-N-arabinofuranosidase